MEEKKPISFSVPKLEYDLWKQYAERKVPKRPMTLIIREAMAQMIQREAVEGTLKEL